MAHPSGHRPSANLLQAQPSPLGAFKSQPTSSASHQHHATSCNTSASSAPNYHNQRQRGQFAGGGGGQAKPAPPPPSAHFNKGHQRRQSVARLLPDISKLRLLSWLVEASNELINCDIAIMDGVYAKLNRSRESLLFWQQSHQAADGATSQAASSRPPPPPPPSVGPVANKIVISQQHQQQQLKKSVGGKQKHQLSGKQDNNKLGRNKSNSLANSGVTSTSAPSGSALGPTQLRPAGTRNHNSLPLTNCDGSSLAAFSLRSNDAGSTSAKGKQLKATESIASASIMMMQQNLQQQQQQEQQHERRLSAANQPTTACQRGSLPLPAESCDTSASQRQAHLRPADSNNSDSCDPARNNQTDEDNANDDEDDDEDDEDDNSSAASSIASSGIHNASISSSVSDSLSNLDAASSSSMASQSSSSSSASVGSSDSFEAPPTLGLSRQQRQQIQLQQQQPPPQKLHQQQRDPSQLSSADQLSERIRRAVMDHNYLQGLLVNIIRQHDRQRDLLNKQRRARLMLQHRDEPSSGRAGPSQQQQEQQQPRIDLADIADAFDHGCQCSCHSMRFGGGRGQARSDSQTDSFDDRSVSLLSTTSQVSAGGLQPASANKRAFTLPSSSTLSLVPAVVARKNRRKKNNGEPSREDLLRKLADRLCENCFETHYWLTGCSSIEFSPTQLQSKSHKHKTCSATLKAAGSNLDQSSDVQSSGATNLCSLESFQQQHNQKTPAKSEPAQLDAIVSLRNATFIKLVQQQVRAVISNSIELIDLIRREIKSPESIKQKQLMRCFSASIQLLSSVANYVVPSQDISTFIPAEIVGQNQQLLGHSSGRHNAVSPSASGGLFSLPLADFDHLLLYPTSMSSSSSYGAHTAASVAFDQQQTANKYHLAPAPEIPMRRRLTGAHSRPQQQQRRSSDEARASGFLHSATLDDNSSLLFDDEASFRSLPLNVTNNPLLDCSREAKPKLSFSGATDLSALAETTKKNLNLNPAPESSSGASSNNSSASSSIARNQASQPSSLSLSSALSAGKRMPSHHLHGHQHHQLHHYSLHQQDHELSFEAIANLSHQHQQQTEHDLLGSLQSGRAKFWQSSKFNFIKKLLQVKQQRLLRQQSKDRRIYNNRVQNKFRLVMMDLTHFNKSQQLLATENGVNSLLTSMRNVLEFGLYLTVKLY